MSFAPLVLLLLSAEPSVQVGGAALAIAELEKLGPITAPWSDHGVTKQAYGVPLSKVLERLGFAPGEKKEKRPGWRKLLVATGADGYRGVFTAAELSDLMGGATKALLTWKLDDKPVPKEQGPFRLVVLTDKEGARCVFQLVKLELADVP